MYCSLSVYSTLKPFSLDFNGGRESVSLMVVTSAALLPTLGGWWNWGGRSESTGRGIVMKGGEGQTGMEGRGWEWTRTCGFQNRYSVQLWCHSGCVFILNKMKDDRTLMETWKQRAACMFHEGSCQVLNEDTVSNRTYCFLSDAGPYPGGAPAGVTTFLIGLLVHEQLLHMNPQWITEWLISVHWTWYEKRGVSIYHQGLDVPCSDQKVSVRHLCITEKNNMIS